MPPKHRAPSGKQSGRTRRPIEKGTAPSSTKDPTKPQVNKELLQRDKKEIVSTLQEQLDSRQIEHDREIKRTLQRIHSLRKDNDKMQRRQEAEYGMTLDTVEDLRIALEQSKLQNDKLYEEMARTKYLHDKLEAELRKTKEKFSNTVEQLNRLEEDSKAWEKTKSLLMKCETRSQEIMRNNKKLRIILLKHHIDPKSNAEEISREADKDSVKSIRTFPEAKPYRRMTVRGRPDDMSNFETIRKINKEFLKKGFGVSDKIFYQVSPAYLGYYIKDLKYSEENDENQEPVYHYRKGTLLPRVFAKF